MTAYLSSKPFTVKVADSQQARDNWDRTFGKKPKKTPKKKAPKK